MVVVVHGVGLDEFGIFYKIWAVFVNDGVEGEAVPPAGGEVPDVDVVVSGSLHLAPEQQGVLRTLGLRTRVVGLNSDLLQVETNQIMLI